MLVHNVKLSLAVYGGFNPVTFSHAPGFNIVSSNPFNDSQLKLFKTTCSKRRTVGMFLLAVVMSEQCWFARVLIQLEVSPTYCCLHFTQVIT